MKWLKQCIAALIVVLFWVSTSLPASANSLIDGGFISDMKALMKGLPDSELAIKIVKGDPVDWVHLAKGYCDLRRDGLSHDEVLEMDRATIPDSAPSELADALTLSFNTMAKLAHLTYCPEVS